MVTGRQDVLVGLRQLFNQGFLAHDPRESCQVVHSQALAPHEALDGNFAIPVQAGQSQHGGE